jgi:hypothetical protein
MFKRSSDGNPSPHGKSPLRSAKRLMSFKSCAGWGVIYRLQSAAPSQN